MRRAGAGALLLAVLIAPHVDAQQATKPQQQAATPQQQAIKKKALQKAAVQMQVVPPAGQVPTMIDLRDSTLAVARLLLRRFKAVPGVSLLDTPDSARDQRVADQTPAPGTPITQFPVDVQLTVYRFVAPVVVPVDPVPPVDTVVPDTAIVPVPDTAVAPVPDTAVAPIPDTAAVPLPDTASPPPQIGVPPPELPDIPWWPILLLAGAGAFVYARIRRIIRERAQRSERKADDPKPDPKPPLPTAARVAVEPATGPEPHIDHPPDESLVSVSVTFADKPPVITLDHAGTLIAGEEVAHDRRR